jgi:hypothetical protein
VNMVLNIWVRKMLRTLRVAEQLVPFEGGLSYLNLVIQLTAMLVLIFCK